jgi:NAD(P)-dependent dehydrogenase (short-subunit alcohol dehydrogenase family)
MVNSFKGKVAVITSGIGRACAVAFAAQGAQAVIADITAKSGAETIRLVEAADGEAVQSAETCSRADYVAGSR